ncbi:tetratricopeptide-like helical domain-containing protein [Heterostelium album PN500]|uniref:Tetratricopeptide-like helical domain-containing protein n=1 Tax=Heterostelium pallidum (strain ATCC 26659 / Pp 5 / PN500) TaxID=670386 RepID=D3BNY6_HETP5|nr:tetratricopeptide-like helical domain-containing protein [Heterostelium album PN500]EFA76905.1 tetratricopeptide-like helical domain-containing protein [Heterostelium album PN500]|eukprot:XP_020429037.1 tetratricopeptide-like helical domain-containing protein [Heterostelium album PN500]
MLERGVSKNPNALLGYHALLKCLVAGEQQQQQMTTKSYDQIRELVGKALELIKSRENPADTDIFIDIHIILFTIIGNCHLLFKLATIYFNDRKYEKSLQYFQQVIDSGSNSSNSSNTSYRSQSIIYSCWIKLISSEQPINDKDLSLIKSDLESAIANDENFHLGYFVLGLLYSKQQRGGEAILMFLKAAQKNTAFSLTFSELGMLYQRVNNDVERAKKCYQKALSLDILNEDAGRSLSDYYITQQQYTLASSLYREITKYCLDNRKSFQLNVVRCSWAFYRLALYQMDLGELDQASTSFLTALKGKPESTIYWRGIGECYRRQTKYIASLKALSHAETLLNQTNEKVPELNYQIAVLNKILGLNDEAVIEFDQVLSQLGKHLPSLKGKAECLFQLAKHYHSNGSSRMALQSLESAETTIQLAIEQDSKIFCLWKLLGDISTFYHHIALQGMNSLDVQQKLQQGADAYLKCQHNNNRSSTLKDLAINHYYQYLCCSSNGPESEKKQTVLRSAIKFISVAINLSSTDYSLWNLMGVILMDSYPLQSQHCFIRSIQLNSTRFEPYNNLCALYLQSNQLDLASSALMVARSNDPDSSSVWSLQGLIHELNGSILAIDQLELAHSDYVHIQSALEQQPVGEALIGSAILAYQHKDNTTAQQQLARYIALYSSTTCSSLIEAHNYLALILESNGQYQLAIDQLHLALTKLVDNNSSSNNNNIVKPNQFSLNSIRNNDIGGNNNQMDNDSITKKKCIEINLSRVQLKAGQWKQCLDTLTPYITEGDKCMSGAVGNSQIWEIIAIANYRLGQPDKSIQAYQASVASIHQAGQDESILRRKKCTLLISLAKVLYQCKKLPQAEQIIEKVLAVDNRFAPAIYLSSAIKILANDCQAAKQLLVDHANKSMSVTLENYILQSIIALQTNDIAQARSQLIRACHAYPHYPHVWKLLLDHLNRYHQLSDSSAIKSILTRLENSRNISANHTVDSDNHRYDAKSIEYTFAKSHLLQVDRCYSVNISESIKQMKRIVHSCPSDTNAWKDLSNLLYLQALHSQSLEDFESALTANRLITDRYGNDNTSKQHSVQLSDILMHLSREKEFTELNQSLLKQHEKDNKIQSQLIRQQARYQLINNDRTSALKLYKQSLTLDNTNIHLYHELSYIYEEMNLLDASLLCLNQSLTLAGANDEDLRLITVGRLMRYYIMMKKWKEAIKIFNDYNNETSNTTTHPILLLFKSIVLLISNNDKKASKQVDNDINNALSLLNQVIAINPRMPLANLYCAIANTKATSTSSLTNSGTNDFNNKIDRLVQQETRNTPAIVPDKIFKDLTLKN